MCMPVMDRDSPSKVVCVGRGADLHMAQLMPLLLTVSCSGKIQICFAFVVPAHPGSPGQRVVKWVLLSLLLLLTSVKMAG